MLSPRIQAATNGARRPAKRAILLHVSGCQSIKWAIDAARARIPAVPSMIAVRRGAWAATL
jgi:hypothetical protein